MATGPEIPVSPTITLAAQSPSPTFQSHPQLGATHILSSASPPRPSFPETSGWKDAPGSGVVIRRLWPQGSLGLWLLSSDSSSVHIPRSRGQEQALGAGAARHPTGPGLLQPLPPAASGSRAVPFPHGRGARATTAGSCQFCVLGFSVPGVTSAHAASAVLPGTSVLREDTWGGCWPPAPRPTKPHKIQQPWAG